MGKFVVGNGQYVVYARDSQEARKVISQELQRFDDIKSKMANLLSEDGKAIQTFLENTSDENLNIHFNDETSLIYDDPDNATTKGEVRQRNLENGKFTYDLAYRYPDIQGHNADFRLAHEMGHLMLNPSNANRQSYNQETDTRQISGLIRVPRGQENNRRAYYGEQMQENAINLIAQLAVRGEHSADDIMSGKVDLSEFNLYKKADDLVKLLAVSMRNDYDKEMSFEQLMEQKIDSMIEHADGTKEPANTFFYGILNDSSIIQKDFDKYMGDGAWKDLNDAFAQLYESNISQARFENIFQTAQALISEYANSRFQDKHKEAVARNGNTVPALDNKINMINEMTEMEQIQLQQPISIQTEKEEVLYEDNVEINNNNFSLKQKIAQFLQKNDMLMNIPFIEKFVDKQLNVLPPAPQIRTQPVNSSREAFVNWISNNGEHRNLPPVQRMSDPDKIANMKRKMEQQTLQNGR